MTSIPGCCIPRGIRIQKLPIFPYFYPKTAPKLAWICVFRPNVQNIQTFVFSKTTNAIGTKILHSYKDHQILVVGCSKICSTIQNSGRPPSWKKWINCYILATVRPISTTFCTPMHIDPANLKKCSKNQFYKNPRGRRPPFWKKVKCDISAAIWPILMKFGTMMYLSLQNWWKTKNWKISNPRWRTAAILKIEKSRYLRNWLADFDEILHDGSYKSLNIWCKNGRMWQLLYTISLLRH